MTMKKSVIKRRKRVIPASQEAAQESNAPIESVESNSPPPDMTGNRGSVNPDGSVNLGLRRRQEDQPLQLVPESVLRQNNRPSPPLPPGDLTQYSSHLRQHREVPESSLTDDNRLAPITSFTAISGRQTSLSPASFLSPTRKRSFGETDSVNTIEGESNKRLSSIKSILYPAGLSAISGSGPSSAAQISPRMLGAEELMQQRMYLQSPATMASAPSPGAYSNASSAAPHSYTDSRRLSNESEMSKAEKRAALQQEADRMRELLAAKERELADLEN